MTNLLENPYTRIDVCNPIDTSQVVDVDVDTEELQWHQLYLIDKVKDNQEAFGRRLIQISKHLNVNPHHLMAVIHLESRFQPDIKNNRSSAVGLLQFIRTTRENVLKTDKSYLISLSSVEQMDYVFLYLNQHKERIHDFLSLYLAVFYPTALPWSMDKEFPESVLEVNKGLASKDKTKLTKRTIKEVFYKRYPKLEYYETNIV